MTNFPDLSNLSNNPGINELMSLPNNSHPFFWLIIFIAIYGIISLTLYYYEKNKRGKSNLLSCMAVAALPIIVLSTIGSLMGIIQVENFIFILVFCLMIVVIWLFTGRN